MGLNVDLSIDRSWDVPFDIFSNTAKAKLFQQIYQQQCFHISGENIIRTLCFPFQLFRSDSDVVIKMDRGSTAPLPKIYVSRIANFICSDHSFFGNLICGTGKTLPPMEGKI